ncbi:MAG: NAD(P)-dependent alcohol dehydrogenase [Bryobacteraceae bacterium]|jgi:NADPH:quinone reductase-like Zn-dependent oxidoreductase
MKAIVYTEYGPPDVLQFTEVAKPIPKDDEVLIQIHAASVNPLDWHFMRGRPYFVRILAGPRKPKVTRLGVDLSGQVEAVGRNVTQFKPGDEVFGACRGAFAEYVCASDRALVVKPDNVTFEQAAAVPTAALTALQGLRDKGQIQPGQKVLINGAAGGVGTFAVQIAKSFGADVTGVCSTRNVDMVRSIGAGQVVDYTREDFTQSGQQYDLILDMIGNHSLSDCRRALTPKGTLVLVGGPDNGRWLGPFTGMLKAVVLTRFGSQKLLPFLAHLSKEDLIILQELLAAGKVTPVIDRSYPLSEVPEAIRYLEEGHAQGKIVITSKRETVSTNPNSVRSSR